MKTVMPINEKTNELSNHNDQVRSISTQRLDPRQRTLQERLVEKKPSLAKTYLGALMVLSDENNIDRFSLAAHGFRELMEKFPNYANISTRPSASMGNKIVDLKKVWQKAKGSCCWQNDMWNGDIDGKLRELLENIDELFKWHEASIPSRAEIAKETFRKIDPSHRSIPSRLETINANWWREMNEFFQAVAHHGKETTIDEFRKYVFALEQFLIERIAPRTYDDHGQIDSILEGSRSANQ